MKWLHTLGSIGLLALTVLTPTLQGLIGSHPLVAAGFGVGYSILGNLLQSPVKPADPLVVVGKK